MKITIPYRPFPAVRTTGKGGRFTPRAVAYHEKMNALRKAIKESDQNVIRKELLHGEYHISFIFATPKSWSKQKRVDFIGEPHTSTPDTDNLAKSFFDTLFYGMGTEDSGIWKISVSKYWGEDDCIIFEY